MALTSISSLASGGPGGFEQAVRNPGSRYTVGGGSSPVGNPGNNPTVFSPRSQTYRGNPRAILQAILMNRANPYENLSLDEDELKRSALSRLRGG